MNKDDLRSFEYDQDRLYRLLDQGKDVNTPDEDGALMLVNAALYDNYPDFINLLLRFGADVFKRDSSGMNAIEAAFLNGYGNIDVLNAVVKGVPLTRDLSRLYRICTAKKPLKGDLPPLRVEGYPNGLTALMAAVLFKRPLSVVRELIDAGADVNEKDKDGWTALRFAHDFKTVKMLIENGADTTVPDNDGDMFCDDMRFDKDMVPVIRLILKQKPPLEIVNRIWGNISAHVWYFAYDRIKNADVIKVFRLLLKAGEDINLACSSIRYPEFDVESFKSVMLNEAVKYGDISIVRFLLKNGADPNTVDGMGCTALIACGYERRARRRQVAKMLIKAGGDPYFVWRNDNPERCHTFMDMIKDEPYRDEIAAYYEKIKKGK